MENNGNSVDFLAKRKKPKNDNLNQSPPLKKIGEFEKIRTRYAPICVFPEGFK